MKRAALMSLLLCALGLLASAPMVRAAQDTLELDEDTIRQMVRDANSDALYSVAYRTGNTDTLSQAWGGEALLTTPTCASPGSTSIRSWRTCSSTTSSSSARAASAS